MTHFDVTYEIVTQESAEDGDTAEDGFVIENARLRDAIEAVLDTRTSFVSGRECIEPSEYPGNGFRWITVMNGMEYETGAYEARALHIPDHVTASSRARILRAIKAY